MYDTSLHYNTNEGVIRSYVLIKLLSIKGRHYQLYGTEISDLLKVNMVTTDKGSLYKEPK